MAHKGSGLVGFFRKVGEAVFGIGKLPSKLKRRARRPRKKPSRVPEREVPKRLRGFFEQRHAGWPEYVMLKVQIAILMLFMAAVVYIVFLPLNVIVFIPLLLALSAYLIYLVPTQLKRAFERDYPAYRSFVVMCISIAWVFVLALRHFPIQFSLEELYMTLVPPLVAIGLVVVAFAAFRIKYGRNFTYGRVEEAQGRRAVVMVGYDICSNVKAGIYTVESFTKIKKGDQVKLSVERPMLGLRGAKVKAILEKASH